MDWLAPIIRHVIAPLWARWERSPYLRHARELAQTQWQPPDVIRQRQDEKFGRMVRHAYESTRFYRERFEQVGLQPCTLRSLDDLGKIPPLTKNELRNHFTDLQARGFDVSNLHQKRTSGSTGVSVQVMVDEDAQQFKRGCTLRSDEWSGWRLGERVAKIWGNPEYLKRGWRGWLRNALLERADYLDTLKMNEATMQAYLERQRRLPPALLFGHAHSLFLLAEFAAAHGGPRFRPRGIISSAMVLLESERRVIEDVFDCPVTNRYGCEEVSLIACECEQRDGLHINSDGVFVEVLRPNGAPAAVGQPGKVVITDLVNRAMPLIRYEVGDMAVLSDRTCACGRTLPLLERIEGRTADYVVTESGALISGISLTENFAVLVPGIAQLQIVQQTVFNFVFRIVKGKEFGEASERQIADLVCERFGDTARFECQFVDRIPQEPSGKYRFCISKVDTSSRFGVNHEVSLA